MANSESRERDPTGGGSSTAGAIGASSQGASSPVDSLVDRMFVTPRVVDQRAFDEMSATLRGLVKDAASQSRMLVGATGDVRGLGEQLRAATKELEDRVKSAAGTLPAIEERTVKAEQLLSAAREELGLKVREFRDLMSGAAALDRSQIEERVRSQVREAIDKEASERLPLLTETLEAAVAHAMEPLTAAKAEAEAATKRAELVEARAASVLERAGTELGRLEEALHRLREVSLIASERAEGLREAAAVIDARIDAARDQLDTSVARVIGRLDEGIVRTEVATAEIESRSAGMLDGLRTEMAALVEHSTLLDVATAEKTAGDLSDAVGRATEAALELRELAGGIGQQREQSEAATRTFATMALQAQQAGDEVGNRILAAAEWIDGLDKSVAGMEARARALVDEAGRRMDRLDTAHAAVTQAHEVGPRLARLVQRAEELERSLSKLQPPGIDSPLG